ncbi:tRNA1(Val) (adenine(37)-N6)-methyltransferase [Flagellimonas sp. S174]|uniref:tRNA1(Val) (adenine(37)-N6)-methyltransferase n=1 Tax=Flagellimonas sp. S174 TaxID=3410790 RepID=UPI003BF58C19
MKVGTDGVLLGAWTSLEDPPNSILDIGAGTGVVALQMAQRSAAELVDAIELDENAYEQCVENFEQSPWSDRLFCYHAGLDEFVDEMDEKYDLIISNPPFYEEQVSSGDVSRDAARQNQSLPFEELLEAVSQLLENNGSFSVIVPFKAEASFIDLAFSFGLFPHRITRVRGNTSSEIKRSMIQLGFAQVTPKETELVIEKSRHQYTQDYVELTKDFYLKM